MNKFRGTGVALVTPFTQSNKVDTHALKALVNTNIQAGISYLVVLGTTAETATLSALEQQLVIDTVVKENARRVPLILGMGGNNTAQLANQIRQSNMEGFDAILSVTPYYNKPTQEGLKAHYRAIAKVSPLPIILYNVPSRTGVNMLPQTSIEIARENENIIGIKEACGNMSQIVQLLEGKPKGFLVISGDDATAYQTTLAGGDGVVSVIAQAIPSIMTKLINGALGTKDPAFKSLNIALQPLFSAIFDEGNPAGIKALLYVINGFPKQVRLPLLPASSILETKLKKEIAKHLLLAPEF